MFYNQIRNGVATAVAAATLVAVPAAAHAQDQPYDKRTFYTFSGPVELPGVALQPGQYVFRLADPDSSRKMIQVVSADGKRVFGTFFSVPIEMAEAPSKPEVRLMEAAPGAPAPIRAVWYANERIGSEFIYPREQAMKIAKTSKQPVLTTSASSSKADDTKSGDLVRLDANGQNTPVDGSNNASSNSASSNNAASNNANGTSSSTTATSQRRANDYAASSTTSQNATPGTVTSQTPGSSTPGASTPVRPAPRQMAQNRTALPRTASPVPAFAAIGVLMLALAAAARFWSIRLD